MEELNLRYELRAYEHPNSCRVAYILCVLGLHQISREEIIGVWQRTWPRHELEGKNGIRRRVGKALSLLSVTNAVSCTDDGATVDIIDWSRLKLAAANLLIVTDDEGVALPPSRWRARPYVPTHLLAIQRELEKSRLGAL